MPIGIIGLPKSGKTTIFNAVTHGHAETTAFRTSGAQAHVGVAKVPNSHLDTLVKIVHPKRVVLAELEYVDIPGGAEEGGPSRGIGGEYLNLLQRCDALTLVARSFSNPAVPHSAGSIDPYRDVATMELEMAFSDLAILERREQRIQESMKGAKASEREAMRRESELVQRIRQGLEAEVPVRAQELPPEVKPLLDNFQLLTAKPLLVLLNIGEEDVSRLEAVDKEARGRLARSKVDAAAVCGKLEMELADMAPEEEAEFRVSLGAGEPALERMVRLSHRLLGLISFLTGTEEEARAWTIPAGATALQAAGKVHTDMQRGFIRAELVAIADLARCGSYAEARRQGVLRAEGKAYVVRDGDVINFLFNV